MGSLGWLGLIELSTRESKVWIIYRSDTEDLVFFCTILVCLHGIPVDTAVAIVKAQVWLAKSHRSYTILCELLAISLCHFAYSWGVWHIASGLDLRRWVGVGV